MGIGSPLTVAGAAPAFPRGAPTSLLASRQRGHPGDHDGYILWYGFQLVKHDIKKCLYLSIISPIGVSFTFRLQSEEDLLLRGLEPLKGVIFI
jgi:hypothetical protein